MTEEGDFVAEQSLLVLRGEARALLSLSQLYEKVEQTADAINYATRARDLFREIGLEKDAEEGEMQLAEISKTASGDGQGEEAEHDESESEVGTGDKDAGSVNEE